MEEQMTVLQALKITVNNLGGIAVPRALNEMIGIPIDNAIGNLNACIEALERDEAERRAKQEEEDKIANMSEEEKEALILHAEKCFGNPAEGEDHA